MSPGIGGGFVRMKDRAAHMNRPLFPEATTRAVQHRPL